MRTMYRIVSLAGGEWLTPDGTATTNPVEAYASEFMSTPALRILDTKEGVARWTVELFTQATV